jgi:hypothetical protein
MKYIFHIRNFEILTYRSVIALGTDQEFSCWYLGAPVSMAARTKAITVFGRSNIGNAASNPARGMDVCLFFSVLCCPV